MWGEIVDVVIIYIFRCEEGEGSNSKFLSMKRLLLNRNMSTNSLVDQFISSQRNLKKCLTVLAIIPEAENRSVNSLSLLSFITFFENLYY